MDLFNIVFTIQKMVAMVDANIVCVNECRFVDLIGFQLSHLKYWTLHLIFLSGNL